MSRATATAPRERPILFSAPMVRAVLADAKTVTRRPAGPGPFRVVLPEMVTGDWPVGHLTRASEGEYEAHLNDYGAASVRARNGEWLGIKPAEFRWAAAPYGNVGDRLWIRETWAAPRIYDHLAPRDIPERTGSWRTPIWYRAAVEVDPSEESWALRGKWRVGRFLPRWAARDRSDDVSERALLEVVRVHVERLQAITEEDAEREGMAFLPDDDDALDALIVSACAPEKWTPLRARFAAGWTAMYAKRPELAWGASPWVWRIEFKRISK